MFIVKHESCSCCAPKAISFVTEIQWVKLTALCFIILLQAYHGTYSGFPYKSIYFARIWCVHDSFSSIQSTSMFLSILNVVLKHVQDSCVPGVAFDVYSILCKTKVHNLILYVFPQIYSHLVLTIYHILFRKTLSKQHYIHVCIKHSLTGPSI